jgi:predicted permease
MRKFAKRLAALWHRHRLDRDLEDELAFHLAMNAQHGGRPFGNTTAFKEACRDLWAFPTLEAWWHDLRFAFRMLVNTPLLTAAAIVALALGIGANTTVFTVVSSALHFDMGVDHIERLVALHPGEGLNSLDPALQAPTDFLNLRGQIKTVDHLAAYRFFAANVSDSHALPERFWCVQMTPSGWAMVRQQAILGRGFGPEDERADAQPTVLLTHKVWQNRYGGDPAILGKTIRVNDEERVVIGVMPVGAQFPEDADLWTPLTLRDVSDPVVRRELLVFGRLAPGVTLAAAQSEVNGVAKRSIASQVNGPVVRVRLFLEMIGVYQVRPVLIAMVFAVGFVLLIVCADVANLLLARAAARAREISIRIAIGAGRARIVRQLLVESVLLATAGGVGGWLVALAGLHWFDAMSSQGHRPSWMHFSMDAHVFAYLAAISIGAGILFGLAPALQLAKVDVIGAIKDGGRGAQGPRGRKLAGMLVGIQMALCVVLLAASGLLIHSTVKLYNAPLSVDASHVLTMRLDLPAAKYSSPDRVNAFYAQLKAALTSVPGVTRVTLGSHIPMLGFRYTRGQAQGGTAQQLAVITAGEDYFRTFAIRMLRGQAGRGQAVVNESFALKYWPGEDAVGRRVQVGGRSFDVSGVAADVQADVMHPLDRFAMVYLPFDGDPHASVFVMTRTAVAPGSLIEIFRRTVQGLDANLQAQDVTPLADRIALQRLNVSSFSLLFAIFAAIALALAWVGLYAVVAQAVSRRTQEIGIRMAMGGTRRDIFALVVKQGMRQVAWGFVAGIPLALVVSRALSRQLVGVSPLDPATYVGVAVVLGLAGFLGSAIPARRAVRVDPLAALRYE